MVVSPLSGFTAIPNPQMLAFMGAQSFIMMYQAGEGWQYGKRKISAMSNDEFNKLTPQIVLEKQAVVLKEALPTIQKSMDAMTPLVGTIVEQYGDFIREIIKAIPGLFENIFGSPEPAPPTVPTPPPAPPRPSPKPTPKPSAPLQHIEFYMNPDSDTRRKGSEADQIGSWFHQAYPGMILKKYKVTERKMVNYPGITTLRLKILAYFVDPTGKFKHWDKEPPHQNA